jgi:nucleotide-binding universal stress UspA family protein
MTMKEPTMNRSESSAAHLVAVLSHPDEVRTTFPWAVALARQWQLPLTLLHVIDPPATRELAENGEAMASDMLALLASAPVAEGLQVSSAVESGMPSAVLPAFAASDNVIHALRSPLVFLPARVPPPRELRLALAGVDGSGVATHALEVGRSLLGDTPIVEVHVLEPGALPSREYLAASAEFSDRRIRMRGRAGVALLAAARGRDVDLIVVGRHGAGGLFGQYLGGTAEWLTHHADRPLLIVPPPR